MPTSFTQPQKLKQELPIQVSQSMLSINHHGRRMQELSMMFLKVIQLVNMLIMKRSFGKMLRIMGMGWRGRSWWLHRNRRFKLTKMVKHSKEMQHISMVTIIQMLHQWNLTEVSSKEMQLDFMRLKHQEKGRDLSSMEIKETIRLLPRKDSLC